MFKSKKLYHLLILFFIVSLVIYIIHFIINYYQINHILFLDKKQLQDFLMKDPDHYYKSFSKKDLVIRKISSPIDYHYLIKMSMDSVSLENVELLKKQFDIKKKELDTIQKRTIQETWLHELMILEKIL
jgi:hypothetical protein